VQPDGRVLLVAEALQAYFGRFGDISECMIMRDPATRRSRWGACTHVRLHTHTHTRTHARTHARTSATRIIKLQLRLGRLEMEDPKRADQ